VPGLPSFVALRGLLRLPVLHSLQKQNCSTSTAGRFGGWSGCGCGIAPGGLSWALAVVVRHFMTLAANLHQWRDRSSLTLPPLLPSGSSHPPSLGSLPDAGRVLDWMVSPLLAMAPCFLAATDRLASRFWPSLLLAVLALLLSLLLAVLLLLLSVRPVAAPVLVCSCWPSHGNKAGAVRFVILYNSSYNILVIILFCVKYSNAENY